MYVEQNCAITFEGRDFTAGGAYVTDTHAAGYPVFRGRAHQFANPEHVGAFGVLNDWHGNKIGTAIIVAKWRTPRSHLSAWAYQIECRIGDRTYTGRGAGSGMLWRGRVKRTRS